MFYVEEPRYEPVPVPRWHLEVSGRVTVATPILPPGLASAAAVAAQRTLVDALFQTACIRTYAVWYYTPMALLFTRHLTPLAVIYDCMDELSAFKNAPSELTVLEAELLQRASLVLTGGHSLYEAKRHRHPNIHPVPSSVDAAHFASARRAVADPDDQRGIAHPRLGFFGVIDERMDLDLVAGVSAARPEWQLVMIGPVVKIDPATLPTAPNIHYLGGKSYEQLPSYIAGWNVAMLPFARNESTRFISPTKTPEYMAAGRPIVSTSIRDVIRPYGELGLVRIADDAASFVAACEAAMADDAETRLTRFDAHLASMSWDDTWKRVAGMVDAAVRAEAPPAHSSLGAAHHARSSARLAGA